MPEETDSTTWKQHLITLADPRRGLWRLLPSPLIAAVHFTVFYIGTSVYCIRSEGGELGDLRDVMGWLTLGTVVTIWALAWGAWRRLRLVRTAPEAPPERRYQVEFLARITLYLAHLSWVGVLFVAAPLLFYRACT